MGIAELGGEVEGKGRKLYLNNNNIFLMEKKKKTEEEAIYPNSMFKASITLAKRDTKTRQR